MYRPSVRLPSYHPINQTLTVIVPQTRFFETEGIAILTMLVSQYKIEIKEEPQFAAETFEERKARVLASKPGLTTT